MVKKPDKEVKKEIDDSVLKVTIKDINKKYGKGTLAYCDDETIDANIQSISTGSYHLNRALGIGGYPRGRVIELYGPEASGKTSLGLHAIREAQKAGEKCAFIDAEHSLNREWGATIGVDFPKLLLSQPSCGEQALEIVDQLVRSGQIGVIVIDSVAALVPEKELKGDMGDSHVGLQARLMSQALRKLTGIVGQTNTIVIFINQTRSKIGVMFGNPETTSGGNALKFYASVRLRTSQGDKIRRGDPNTGTIIGQFIRVKVSKCKVAPPYKECKIPLLFEEGFSIEQEILDLAILGDVIVKSGAWFSYEGSNIGQGREKVIQWFKDNPETFEKIIAAVEGETELKTEAPDMPLVTHGAGEDA